MIIKKNMIIKKLTGASFRLVYIGKKVIDLIEGTEKSTTLTLHETKEFVTKQTSLDEIRKLNLIHNEFGENVGVEDIEDVENIFNGK